MSARARPGKAIPTRTMRTMGRTFRPKTDRDKEIDFRFIDFVLTEKEHLSRPCEVQGQNGRRNLRCASRTSFSRIVCVLTLSLAQFLNSGASASPPPSASFPALEDDGGFGHIVPDTNGAVGPNHVMTPLNTQIRIQDRNGSEISIVDLQAFWSGVPGCTHVFDPVVVFDPYVNRWFFTAMCSVQLFLAVSQTSDPTGAWNKYGVPSGAIDQPKIGFNGKWIAVQVEALENPNFSKIFLFDKAALMAGAGPPPNPPAQNYQMISGSSAQGSFMSPARTYDADLPDLYLLQSSNVPYQVSTNALTIFKISGDSAATATLSTVGQAAGPSSGARAFPSVRALHSQGKRTQLGLTTIEFTVVCTATAPSGRLRRSFCPITALPFPRCNGGRFLFRH